MCVVLSATTKAWGEVRHAPIDCLRAAVSACCIFVERVDDTGARLAIERLGVYVVLDVVEQVWRMDQRLQYGIDIARVPIARSDKPSADH